MRLHRCILIAYFTIGKSTLKEDVIVATPCKMKGKLQRCPTCSSVLHIVQGTDWQASPVAQCANKRCAVVGTLLTCGLVSDPNSKVKGCPEFRACPKCYSLLMHSCGCKYVTCFQCSHKFCYICLSDSEECRKDIELYWSLTCSKPTAGRQCFTGPY